MKTIKIVLCLCLFASFLFADWSESQEFLTVAEASIASGATATDGSEYTSWKRVASSGTIAITGEFTIVTGDGANVEFRIFASYDNAANWSYLTVLEIPSNTTPATGTTVRQTFFLNAGGISHVIVKSIKNGDAVNAITNVQAYLSYKLPR